MLNKNAIKIALAILIVVVLFRMFSAPKAPETFSGMDTDFVPQATVMPRVTKVPAHTKAAAHAKAAAKAAAKATAIARATGNNATLAPTLAPLATSADLLPKPSMGTNSEFGEFAPTQALAAQNFIDASKLIGVDTQGSSLRNANRQLRRDPPIPRVNVGPWGSSTIQSDLTRKSLDC